MCPMSSAIASGGQCEVPEGVQMLWEAELGVAGLNATLLVDATGSFSHGGQRTSLLLSIRWSSRIAAA